MIELDAQFPEYGLAKHKGYISAGHTAAIAEHGVKDFHRRSFSNIAEFLKQS
jgi:ribonuclease HII